MVEPNIPQRSIFLRNWLNNKKFILEHIEVKNVLKKILVDQKYSNYIFEKIFVAKKIKIRQKIRIILREIRFMRYLKEIYNFFYKINPQYIIPIKDSKFLSSQKIDLINEFFIGKF